MKRLGRRGGRSPPRSSCASWASGFDMRAISGVRDDVGDRSLRSLASSEGDSNVRNCNPRGSANYGR